MEKTADVTEFYRQTSCFTDLGLYRSFAGSLTDDIRELCLLQRAQIIHPVVLIEMRAHGKTKCRHGDITEIPADRLLFENERFQTAGAVLAELLRRDGRYSAGRRIRDKMHLTCREQAILLAAILKAKGVPARVRSGFAPYITGDGVSCDHWICERYDEREGRWLLTDADCAWDIDDFDFTDIPRGRFIFGAAAYLGLRNGSLRGDELRYASVPPETGMRAALRAVFFDFHSLMNDEIFFWHTPRYVAEKDFSLSEDEYAELDSLAALMTEPDRNFDALRAVWQNTMKFRILSGGFN